MPLHELFMGLRQERERLLRTVIGTVGQGPVIEPPFNFQYGCNVALGDSFYANVKSVLHHYMHLNHDWASHD